MRDEQHSLFGLIPKPKQLFIEVVTHDFVECSERFVHQKERGYEGQSARDRGALPHAAGELPGIFALETR